MSAGGPAAPAVSAEVVAERLALARARIDRAGGTARAVTIVAVTKGFGPCAVGAAVDAGLSDLGENYAHELLAKAAVAPAGARWHYLGALQRNKLARIAPLVHLWHGLDNGPAAVALARRRPGAAVLVQVRLVERESRQGALPGDVPRLVGQAMAAGLQVKGLMAMAPRSAGPDVTSGCFRQVARLARSLGLDELSMGMSGDFELAVAEGATIVRLGRALFGERPRATTSELVPRGGAQPG